MVERNLRTPQDIKEEYERIVKEKEEQRLQQRTNPKGTLTVTVDATDMFEVYSEDGDDEDDADEDYEFELPDIEIRSMTISQSIEAPLTLQDNLLLSGNISVRNGIGSGTVSSSIRHVFSRKICWMYFWIFHLLFSFLAITWCEAEFSAGQGPMLSFKGYRTLNKNLHANGQVSFLVTPFKVKTGYVGSKLQVFLFYRDLTIVIALTQQFNKNLIGYLTFKTGIDNSLSTVVVYENEFHRVNGSITVVFNFNFAVFLFYKLLCR